MYVKRGCSNASTIHNWLSVPTNDTTSDSQVHGFVVQDALLLKLTTGGIHLQIDPYSDFLGGEWHFTLEAFMSFAISLVLQDLFPPEAKLHRRT